MTPLFDRGLYVGSAQTTFNEVETTLSDAWDAYRSTHDTDRLAPFEDAFEVSYDHMIGIPEPVLSIEADLYHCHLLRTDIDEPDTIDAGLHKHWSASTSPVARYLPDSFQETPTKRDEFLYEQLQALFPD